MTFLELTPKAQCKAAFDYLVWINESRDASHDDYHALTIEEAYDICADVTIQEDYDYDHEGNVLAIQGELF